MLSDLQDNYFAALTNRELDILRLLETGASNQEIADTLIVEVSTVKWYNSQIYEKLQVKNRKQAVIRAQRLGILESNKNTLIRRVQYNLPSDTLPFIGREQELKQLVHYLTSDTVRLITVLGIGGMGKTRMSIELGRRLISYFGDGVYFVSLAPVTSTEQIITTLADVIGFKFHSDTEPRHQLLDYLHHQHLLLIMDNFEHMLDSANLLSDIMQNAPKVKVLVTSREKLNLASEVVYLLNGLSLPYEAATEGITDYDSVQLFTASARRTNAEIDNNDISVVARICRLLGGMPLGILLASAWLDTLSLTEIEAEIQKGLGILEANLRDAPARHHSIQATFDYSWKRLTEHEQAIFMKLSVFRDGFTREAAQKVTGASLWDLQRLVHTSFVQLTPSGRYSTHVLMRQHGEAKLQASGETRAAQEKHAQHFGEFIKPLGDTPWSMATHVMLEMVKPEFNNIRAAWLYQAERRNISALRRFLDGIWHFCDQYSRSQEGIDLFEPLLSTLPKTGDDVTLFRAQLLARLSWFYSDTGQHQTAIELSQKSLKTLETFNATDDISLVCQLLFLIYGFLGNTQAAIKYGEKGFILAQETKWRVPCTFTMAECLFQLSK